MNISRKTEQLKPKEEESSSWLTFLSFKKQITMCWGAMLPSCIPLCALLWRQQGTSKVHRCRLRDTGFVPKWECGRISLMCKDCQILEFRGYILLIFRVLQLLAYPYGRSTSKNPIIELYFISESLPSCRWLMICWWSSVQVTYLHLRQFYPFLKESVGKIFCPISQVVWENSTTT